MASACGQASSSAGLTGPPPTTAARTRPGKRAAAARFQDAAKRRVDHGEVRDAVLLDGAVEIRGREGCRQHHARARRARSGAGCPGRPTWKKGSEASQRSPGPSGSTAADARALASRLPRVSTAPLGRPRRAGREEDGRVAGRIVLARERRTYRRRAACATRRATRRGRRAPAARRARRSRHHRQRGARHLPFDLGIGEPRVERHEHAARARDRERDDDPVRRVLGPEADARLPSRTPSVRKRPVAVATRSSSAP